jgi:hypothetical protein
VVPDERAEGVPVAGQVGREQRPVPDVVVDERSAASSAAGSAARSGGGAGSPGRLLTAAG